MWTNVIKAETGCILVSEPFLKDFYFKRSVVLLADHNDDGSFGMIINKPIKIHLSDVTSEFPDFDPQVYIGGPVKSDSLFVMHRLGDLIPNSIKILKGLYWGGDMAVIKEMIRRGEIKEEDIRFYIGYAGWAPKQLDQELDENAWVVVRSDANKLIKTDPEVLWADICKELGDEFAQWVNYPLDPSEN
ncbi:MAG: YqgE/AlgH family protein [Bacteroidales bacterium]|nr:YqgE/AlgH family protein [Bacteroidales bacterium]